ncbi:MAG: PDZ domain-containing protein [Rubripirellula sp.]
MSQIKNMPLFLLLVAFGLSDHASADERRDSTLMMELVDPITSKTDTSVVQVICGGRPVSLGTVVSADGYIMTKRSELSGDPIRVRLHDGRLFPAYVASVRRRNDLALLHLQSPITLVPVEFSPMAPPIASFLVSVGRTGSPIGIGVLGVPARRIGHSGRLGVVLNDDSSGRALVENVWPDSGADIAGIEPGDLIVAINGSEKYGRAAVINTLRDMFPGERVPLRILRKNDMSVLETLELVARIREFRVMQESESDTKVNGPRSVRLSGFDNVIQHDTVLDPDECGGPVLDTQGRVIGLNIARAGRVVSYALPSGLIMSEMVGMLEEARASTR